MHDIVLCDAFPDSSIQVILSSHSLSTEPLERYVGHTELVTNIIYQNDQLISASWDRLVYSASCLVHVWYLHVVSRLLLKPTAGSRDEALSC